MSLLPAAVVDFGICRIQLGLPDRRGGIDAIDHVVLPVFPRRRPAHIHDRCRIGWRLPVPLHHLAPAGLRAAHGGHRALCCAGDRNVRHPQSGLVRTRRELGVDREYITLEKEGWGQDQLDKEAVEPSSKKS